MRVWAKITSSRVQRLLIGEEGRQAVSRIKAAHLCSRSYLRPFFLPNAQIMLASLSRFDPVPSPLSSDVSSVTTHLNTFESHASATLARKRSTSGVCFNLGQSAAHACFRAAISCVLTALRLKHCRLLVTSWKPSPCVDFKMDLGAIPLRYHHAEICQIQLSLPSPDRPHSPIHMIDLESAAQRRPRLTSCEYSEAQLKGLLDAEHACIDNKGTSRGSFPSQSCHLTSFHFPTQSRTERSSIYPRVVPAKLSRSAGDPRFPFLIPGRPLVTPPVAVRFFRTVLALFCNVLFPSVSCVVLCRQ